MKDKFVVFLLTASVILLCIHVSVIQDRVIAIEHLNSDEQHYTEKNKVYEYDVHGKDTTGVDTLYTPGESYKVYYIYQK